MIYREMCRKDQEVKDLSRIEAVIDRAPFCHLAFFDGEWSYVIPISFGYEPGHLYFHSAKEGKKVDIVKINSRVSFSMEVDTVPVPMPKTRSGLVQPYRSVIGYGEASLTLPTAKAGGFSLQRKQRSSREKSVLYFLRRA